MRWVNKFATNRYPQLAKEPLLTSRMNANPENRAAAKLIDVALVEAIITIGAFFWEPSSFVLAVLLWGGIDILGRGQSPGKWLLGIHTIEVRRGTKANFYSGMVRNFPFILFSWGIGRGGWTAVALLVPAAICVFIEFYFIFNVRSGIRVGDILGVTRVCDYKDEHTKFIEQFLKEEEGV